MILKYYRRMFIWTEIGFGKYEGKTLPQIVFADPDYFFWAFETGVFNKPGLASQAAEVNRRARRIAIPLGKGGQKRHAEYLFHAPTGKFGAMRLIPETQAAHQGSSGVAERLEVIDLSVPRSIKGYDKQGCGLLMATVKEYLFGDSGFRITKKRAGDFFSTDKNFAL